MIPVFYDSAALLKKGEFTKKPVHSEHGYHVILVTDVQEAKELSYKEVKGFIEEKLKVEVFNEQMQTKMNELKKTAKITFPKK